jgi:hypothetical protein
MYLLWTLPLADPGAESDIPEATLAVPTLLNTKPFPRADHGPCSRLNSVPLKSISTWNIQMEPSLETGSLQVQFCQDKVTPAGDMAQVWHICLANTQP